MADNIGAVKNGTTGVSDNDVLITLDNAIPFDTFQIQSTAGAMDVFVSLDGTNYATAPLALLDQGATASTTYVLVTAANRTYQFRGKFRAIRVLQNGAAAVTAPTMTYGNM